MLSVVISSPLELNYGACKKHKEPLSELERHIVFHEIVLSFSMKESNGRNVQHILRLTSAREYAAETKLRSDYFAPPYYSLQPIEDNKISIVGAREIAAGLSRNTTLRELYLGYNDIKNEGTKLIARAVRNNRSLLALVIGRFLNERRGQRHRRRRR